MSGGRGVDRRGDFFAWGLRGWFASGRGGGRCTAGLRQAHRGQGSGRGQRGKRGVQVPGGGGGARTPGGPAACRDAGGRGADGGAHAGRSRAAVVQCVVGVAGGGGDGRSPVVSRGPRVAALETAGSASSAYGALSADAALYAGSFGAAVCGGVRGGVVRGGVVLAGCVGRCSSANPRTGAAVGAVMVDALVVGALVVCALVVGAGACVPPCSGGPSRAVSTASSTASSTAGSAAGRDTKVCGKGRGTGCDERATVRPLFVSVVATQVRSRPQGPAGEWRLGLEAVRRVGSVGSVRLWGASDQGSIRPALIA